MKSRFCPSPTGYMHLGNARTALFNALLARSMGGSFLLRIEDSDHVRSEEHFDEHLQSDLLWLGLPWQEGPAVGGDHQPYYQSQRDAIYEQYYERLIQERRAYPCFCSEQALAIARKLQLASGQAPRYSGTCRHLSPEECTEKTAQGLRPALRFLSPENQLIEFTDLVRGPQSFNSNDIGDFIIRRADGTSSFMFCNAIDDALMGVTHALRGEDHLSNTPRQLLILNALDLPSPTYGHISLIMGMDGTPLSKRHGSRSIRELREQGFLKEAIVNYMGRLGHHYERPDYMDFSELAAHFSTTALGSSPSRYDPAQLLYWQKEAILRTSNEDLWTWMGDVVHQRVPSELRLSFIEAVRHNMSFPEDAVFWADILCGDHLDYSSETKERFSKAGAAFFETVLSVITEQGVLDYTKMIETVQTRLAIKGKALFQPLRLALTGEIQGPEMAHILQLLGQHKVQARLRQAAMLA